MSVLILLVEYFIRDSAFNEFSIVIFSLTKVLAIFKCSQNSCILVAQKTQLCGCDFQTASFKNCQLHSFFFFLIVKQRLTFIFQVCDLYSEKSFQNPFMKSLSPSQYLHFNSKLSSLCEFPYSKKKKNYKKSSCIFLDGFKKC